MSGLIAFFSSLPAIITLLGQIGTLMQKLLHVANTNNLNGWINDLEKRIDKLSAAKTDEEKYKAIQDLLSSIHHVGSD